MQNRKKLVTHLRRVQGDTYTRVYIMLKIVYSRARCSLVANRVMDSVSLEGRLYRIASRDRLTPVLQ